MSSELLDFNKVYYFNIYSLNGTIYVYVCSLEQGNRLNYIDDNQKFYSTSGSSW